MARRPVFIPEEKQEFFVRTYIIEFQWHSGFSKKQKQMSIKSFHEEIKRQTGIEKILEISTKSHQFIGAQLSAFNLILKNGKGESGPVEAFYQGSKVFSNGGPFLDLYQKKGWEVKNDKRLKESGCLMGFVFEGRKWDVSKSMVFYNWLYFSALWQNFNLAKEILNFDAFTDIEFNPKKSVNCQAASAALFKSLKNRGILEDIIFSIECFLEFFDSHPKIFSEGRGGLF